MACTGRTGWYLVAPVPHDLVTCRPQHRLHQVQLRRDQPCTPQHGLRIFSGKRRLLFLEYQECGRFLFDFGRV
eukprot:3929968-Rhodomonas_salina.2